MLKNSEFTEFRANQLLAALRQTMIRQNISIDALFQSYDSDSDKNLDFFEFSKLLLQIDSSLTEDDIACAFWKFDADNSESISIAEFKKKLREPPRRPPQLMSNQSQQNLY